MVKFKDIKTTARIVDGSIDMLTVFIPFGMLPDKAKFRYGYEQDDLTFTKTKNFQESPEKLVLVDFLSYRHTKDKKNFRNRGIFKQSY